MDVGGGDVFSSEGNPGSDIVFRGSGVDDVSGVTFASHDAGVMQHSIEFFSGFSEKGFSTSFLFISKTFTN
jgi:hypothetical protein